MQCADVDRFIFPYGSMLGGGGRSVSCRESNLGSPEYNRSTEHRLKVFENRVTGCSEEYLK
jgi:hypothetical protein